MGGGLNRHACITVRSSMSVLFVTQIHFGRNTASLRNIHTAPTAAQRWMEVTAIALWHEQEQMMDIGGMVTIFVVMGERKMGNEQIPLPYIKAYRKALRDVVDWLERHEQQMKAYKLTTGKDYMAFLRMFRDEPDSLMEMGGFADEYKVPDECKDKVKKVIEKRKEKEHK